MNRLPAYENFAPPSPFAAKGQSIRADSAAPCLPEARLLRRLLNLASVFLSRVPTTRSTAAAVPESSTVVFCAGPSTRRTRQDGQVPRVLRQFAQNTA